LYSIIYEIANIFNRYFIDSILETLESDDTLELIIDKYTESKFEVFNIINVGELNRIVNRLVNKSDTEEGITVEIMKRVADIKLYEVLNRSSQRREYSQMSGKKLL